MYKNTFIVALEGFKNKQTKKSKSLLLLKKKVEQKFLAKAFSVKMYISDDAQKNNPHIQGEISFY